MVSGISRIGVIVLCISLLSFFRPDLLHPEALTQDSATAPAAMTFEAAFGDGVQDYTTDLLIPFWNWAEGLVFFNPRVALTEDDGSAERFSLGFGLRHLFGDHLLLGANLYYDRDSSEADRNYNQFGIGLELLSEWVDGRFNYYLPEDDPNLIGSFDRTEQYRSSRSWWDDPYAKGHGIWQKRRTRTVTTTIIRRFEFFEEAMAGWDAEIGVKLPFLPQWAETRLFFGGYRFEAPYGDDLQGWKGRVEVRPMRGLIIDAAVYEDAELYGADWAVGARLSIPFDMDGLLAGDNPFHQATEWFRPGQRPFTERLGEMVIRDGRVHAEAWGPIENLAAKQTQVETQETAKKYTLLPDVMFVDAGRAGERQDGTWEHPFDLVQKGVDGVFGERNVYVNAFAGSYRENVVLTDGVQLWGSGWLIDGYDNRTFGSGVQPIIDGGGTGPVIRLASDNSVRGFHLVNLTLGTPIFGPTTMFGPRSIQNTGIFGSGISGSTVIEGNTIETLGDGVMLAPASGSIFVHDNNITSDFQSGIYIQAENAVLDAVSITNNTSNGGPGWDGITLTSEGSTIQNLHINNNNLSGTWGLYSVFDTSHISSIGIRDNMIIADEDGILLVNDNSSLISSLTVSGNTISAGLDGIYLVNNNSSSISSLAISGNSIHAGSDGIHLVNDNSSSISSLAISGNSIHAGSDGIHLVNDNSSSISSLTITGNSINTIFGATGVFFSNTLSSPQSVVIIIAENTISSMGWGILYGSISSSPSQMILSGNIVSTRIGIGFMAINSIISVDFSGNTIAGPAIAISLQTNPLGATPGVITTIDAFTSGAANILGFSHSAFDVYQNPPGSITNNILWAAP
ncbi:right-handed parallel beta-helix repeat-containing protein [bacterium]|nr:right-handed parallel beta-helix repeat-containing protein [bacterium]